MTTSQYKYTGITPYSYDEHGSITFLLGRESIIPGWSESGKWSDFGGSPDHETENVLDSAVRECFEETMGILGCQQTLKDKLQTCSQIVITNDKSSAMIYLMPIEYDTNLPIHFNRIYNYLTKCSQDHPSWKGFRYIPSCPEGYYEKIEMKWVTINTIKNAIISNDESYRKSFLNSMKVIVSQEKHSFSRAFKFAEFEEAVSM
ncbi:Hypothetical protein HVR_LOCUS10 [uncultured virus]|nr:Hypothetical protein HVR_LOCUS10 [uncultured virus]